MGFASTQLTVKSQSKFNFQIKGLRFEVYAYLRVDYSNYRNRRRLETMR